MSVNVEDSKTVEAAKRFELSLAYHNDLYLPGGGDVLHEGKDQHYAGLLVDAMHWAAHSGLDPLVPLLGAYETYKLEMGLD